jgi:hypothetical protein
VIINHERYEELAAGYALEALEPQDEQPFLVHLSSCPMCRQLVAEFREAAGNLALLADPAPVPAHLGETIRAAALGESATPLRVVGSPARSRRRDRSRRPAALLHRRAPMLLAAAAALLIAAGVGTGLAVTGQSAPGAPTTCSAATGCHRIVLSDATTHRPAAVVLVQSGVAYLLPRSLPPDNEASEIYVLWQVTGAHTPLPVASFDVRSGQHSAIKMGPLAAPYSATWAFAVSLEQGRVIPPAPSHPVALGTVSS